MAPGNQMSLGIEAGIHGVAARRTIEVVSHVVFARPEELYRLANCLRNEDRFRRKIESHGPLSPKTAAYKRGVNSNGRKGQSGYCCGIPLNGTRGLQRPPYFASVLAHVGSAVQGLDGLVSEKGRRVCCGKALAAGLKRFGYVPVIDISYGRVSSEII